MQVKKVVRNIQNRASARQGIIITPARKKVSSTEKNYRCAAQPRTVTMTSWLNLTGRKAIITGAASGIGSAVARTLALQGCSVICSDVDIDGMLLLGEEERNLIMSFLVVEKNLFLVGSNNFF